MYLFNLIDLTAVHSVTSAHLQTFERCLLNCADLLLARALMERMEDKCASSESSKVVLEEINGIVGGELLT